MTLFQDLQQTLVQSVDEYEVAPDNLYVERDGEAFVATGSWWETYTTKLFEDGDEMEMPHPKKHEVTLEGELASRVRTVFNQFTTNVSAPEGTLKPPTLKQVHDNSLLDVEMDANLAFFCLATREQDMRLPDRVLDALLDSLRELDPDLTADEVAEISFLFSDQHENKLVNVSGTVLTPRPHRYYSDVETLEEYLEVAREKGGVETDGPTYEVFYKLRSHEDDVPAVLQEFAEATILERGTDMVESPFDSVFEAEELLYADGVEDAALFLYTPLESVLQER